MGFKTPLYETHVAAGARMVDFGGWDMPVHYGSQIEEHHAVRRDAGMFDVSHMLIADVSGARARDYLRYLLANDVAKLKDPGKALYSCMLNERGGVVDDLITYFGDEQHDRVVVNAGTRDKDTAWLKRWAEPFKVDIQPRTDLAMVAVQDGLDAQGRATRMIMQVHDELVFEVPAAELDWAKAAVPALMAGVAALKVPLLAEVGVGDNWDEAH